MKAAALMRRLCTVRSKTNSPSFHACPAWGKRVILYPEMKPRVLLPILAVAAMGLTMCQVHDDTALPAGMVRSADPEADALLKEAIAYDKAGQFGKAFKPLKRIVNFHELSPNAAQARYMLGQMYEKDQDYRQAFKEYEKVITRYHDSSYYNKALDRQLTMAMDAVSGKMKVPVFWGLWKTDMEYSVVEEWLQSIVRSAPYSDTAPTALSLLAQYQLKKDKLASARATYQQLAYNYPDSPLAPGAQLKVAKLWAEEKARGSNNMVNITKAQEAYEEFLLRYPGHKESGKARSEIAKMRGLIVSQELEVGKYYLERAREYTAAMQCFQNVINLGKDNPQAAAEAKQLYQKASRLASGSAQ